MTDANEALRRIQRIAEQYAGPDEIMPMMAIQTICKLALETDPGYVRIVEWCEDDKMDDRLPEVYCAGYRDAQSDARMILAARHQGDQQ